MNQIFLKTLLLAMAIAQAGGCAAPASNQGETRWSASTSSVVMETGKNISHEDRYDDPLYYYSNAFDYLYLN